MLCASRSLLRKAFPPRSGRGRQHTPWGKRRSPRPSASRERRQPAESRQCPRIAPPSSCVLGKVRPVPSESSVQYRGASRKSHQRTSRKWQRHNSEARITRPLPSVEVNGLNRSDRSACGRGLPLVKSKSIQRGERRRLEANQSGEGEFSWPVPPAHLAENCCRAHTAGAMARHWEDYLATACGRGRADP